jgi:integrase
MGSVYKKTFTKPVPADAELFTRKAVRFARWKDAKGKTRMARVTTGKDGSPRLLIDSETFTAKYRDGGGAVREVATGCHDETSARQVLAGLVQRSEHVKSGLVTQAQDQVIDQQGTAIGEHVTAYVHHLNAKGGAPARILQVESRLNRVFTDCGYRRLNDLSGEGLEKWLVERQSEGMSAATRNGYREAAVGFGNWCRRTRRIIGNPFADVPIANVKADPRRHRRALTESELVKLLDVARRRPLLDTQTLRTGKRRGETVAKVRPEVKARLETLGRERALIYKTLVLTGLRKGELASLTAAQLDLNGDSPSALLYAADEKNRQGSRIPLRGDLAADLRGWLADKLTAAQDTARQRGETIPARLPGGTPLFTVPAQLVKILDRDLVMAGIARKVKDENGIVRIDKRDGRGWTLDVHALRHTFGTLLSKGGVAPRTAQAAMRHSSIDLTMNVYTDPKMINVAGALDALPLLPLYIKPQVQEQKATGTYDSGPLAPTLAPNADESGIRLANAVKAGDGLTKTAGSLPASQVPVIKQQKHPLSLSDNGCQEKRAMRLELTTFTLAT